MIRTARTSILLFCPLQFRSQCLQFFSRLIHGSGKLGKIDLHFSQLSGHMGRRGIERGHQVLILAAEIRSDPFQPGNGLALQISGTLPCLALDSSDLFPELGVCLCVRPQCLQFFFQTCIFLGQLLRLGLERLQRRRTEVSCSSAFSSSSRRAFSSCTLPWACSSCAVRSWICVRRLSFSCSSRSCCAAAFPGSFLYIIDNVLLGKPAEGDALKGVVLH